MENKNIISVQMICPDLSQTADFALPEGYSIRTYLPGDEKVWFNIQQLADDYSDITQTLFQKAFGADADLLAQRQLFLIDKWGNPIGTSTAWFGNDQGDKNWGRIHWVAIIPTAQGKGLAKPLLAATCNKLLEFGHTNAFLKTANIRLSAINLYQKFGFQSFKLDLASS